MAGAFNPYTVPKTDFHPLPDQKFCAGVGRSYHYLINRHHRICNYLFCFNFRLVGEAGRLIIPIFSIILLIYLVVVWLNTAKSLSGANNNTLHSKDAVSLAKLLAFSIVTPIIIGFIYSKLDASTANNIQQLFDQVFVFSAWTNLAFFVLVSVIVIAASWGMIRERFRLAHPVTEVCEYRETLQESVHPNEIFIHIKRQCARNFTYQGTFLSGRTYKTSAVVNNVSLPTAMKRISRFLAKNGWTITKTDKESGIISATQSIRSSRVNTVPFNVVVQAEPHGVNISITYFLAAGLTAPLESIKNQFCSTIEAAAN